MSNEITGDLYSQCPKCGSMDTKFVGTEAGDPIYECKSCGKRFFPHMKIFELSDFSITGYGSLVKCPKCGHEFYPEHKKHVYEDTSMFSSSWVDPVNVSIENHTCKEKARTEVTE